MSRSCITVTIFLIVGTLADVKETTEQIRSVFIVNLKSTPMLNRVIRGWMERRKKRECTEHDADPQHREGVAGPFEKVVVDDSTMAPLEEAQGILALVRLDIQHAAKEAALGMAKAIDSPSAHAAPYQEPLNCQLSFGKRSSMAKRCSF